MNVFFDEVRHDRHWRYMLAIPVTAAGSLLGAAVAGYGFAAWVNKGNGAGLFIALVFGLPLAFAFGFASFTFVRRSLRPPVRVRIDTDGVHLGSRTLTWTQIAAIEAQYAGPNRTVWIFVRPIKSAGRPVLLPGPPFLEDRWNRLASQLAEHFRRSELQVRLD